MTDVEFEMLHDDPKAWATLFEDFFVKSNHGDDLLFIVMNDTGLSTADSCSPFGNLFYITRLPTFACPPSQHVCAVASLFFLQLHNPASCANCSLSVLVLVTWVLF